MADNFISPPRILIVDDMAQNVAILGRLLKKDYEVLVATSGKEALLLARGEVPPDLILLDIMMPEMDGYEVCKRLKEDPETVDIPVIFVTAKTSMDDEAYGLKLGAVDYIAKPYQVPIIRARVNNQIELLRARRTAEIAHSKLSRELESMNELQKRILPTREFKSGSLFAQGIYIPSSLASGDYFDYLSTADGGLRCVVADVSGHGARAAFIMANVRAVFHFEQTRNLAPSELINTLNLQLMQTLGDEGDFITIFVADINPEKDRIEYVSAGHCPAFFRDDLGFREIEATESIVGVFEADFKSKVMDTHGDWQLLIYTDGIYECTVDGSEIFGYENFRDLCSRLLENEEFQVISLPKQVKETAGGNIQIRDDQTALYVKSISSL
ncbi:MAG: PP2C family protein-serine/threonine phosphatase [Thermodesulfobacteriota bacterium]